jgi:hypothetical protein
MEPVETVQSALEPKLSYCLLIIPSSVLFIGGFSVRIAVGSRCYLVRLSFSLAVYSIRARYDKEKHIFAKYLIFRHV